MKHYIPLILISVFIYGCKVGCKTKSDYERPIKQDSFQAKVHMTYRQPYCGGARPSPEMERGTVVDFKNKEFVIKEGTSNHDSIPIFKRVITDEKGEFQISLPKGEYAIILPHKAKSYDKFKNEELKKFDNKQLKLTNDECLRAYWLRADAKIVVNDEAQFELEIRRTCYADFNYCMQYTGPLPP